MKIERKLITVTLGEEDPATIVFERQRSNKQSKIRKVLSRITPKEGDEKAKTITPEMLDALDEYRDLVLDSCISVADLYFGDKKITLKDIKERNLYDETIELLLAAYYGVIAAERKEGEEEVKNEKQQQDSSKD